MVIKREEEESLALMGWSLNLDVWGEIVCRERLWERTTPGLLKTPRRVNSSGSRGHSSLVTVLFCNTGSSRRRKPGSPGALRITDVNKGGCARQNLGGCC